MQDLRFSQGCWWRIESSERCDDYLWNRGHDQRIHASFWVVDFLLYKAWIHNIIYPINSEWCLCNICCYHNLNNTQKNLTSVCPCVVDDMKRVKPTRCYTMVYRTLWIAQYVSGIIMPTVRSLRLYRWPQRVAPRRGYGRLLVWCVVVGLSAQLEGCFTTGCAV